MKITKILPILSHIIETDAPNTYRRNSGDDWEVKYGDLWEPVCCDTEDLEDLFQQALKF